MEAIKKRGRHRFFIIWAGTKVSKRIIRYSPKFEKNRNFFFFKLFGKLYLWGSNIKDADDLKSLKNLETICIYDTPLSKDETEVESLCKAFPNAKIFISEDKVQNIDIKEE